MWRMPIHRVSRSWVPADGLVPASILMMRRPSEQRTFSSGCCRWRIGGVHFDLLCPSPSVQVQGCSVEICRECWRTRCRCSVHVCAHVSACLCVYLQVKWAWPSYEGHKHGEVLWHAYFSHKFFTEDKLRKTVEFLEENVHSCKIIFLLVKLQTTTKHEEVEMKEGGRKTQRDSSVNFKSLFFLLDVVFLCWTSQKVEVHSHEGKHEQRGHRCRQTAGHSEAAVWSRRRGEHICLCCRLCVLSIDVWLCVCSRVFCGRISTDSKIP